MEALEQGTPEKHMARLMKARVVGESGPSGVVPDPVPPISDAAKRCREKLLAVYHAIESTASGSASRVITFVGTESDAGTVILLREFAKMLSQQLRRRVVVLETPTDTGEYRGAPRAHAEGDCTDVASGRRRLEDILSPVDGESMLWGRLAPSGAAVTSLLHEPGFHETIRQMRHGFDYVLFHASADPSGSGSMGLVAESDGVILVVEAEKTRWQVAKNTCDEIVALGGNILGVVLNRQRHHIPKRIYEKL